MKLCKKYWTLLTDDKKNSRESIVIIESFTVYTKLVTKDLTAAKKLPPVGVDLMITGSRDYYWLYGSFRQSLNGTGTGTRTVQC